MKIIHSLFFILLISSLAYTQGIPDNKTDYLITLVTDKGDIKLILYDETPIHKLNFIHLASEGVYDHITFHRVIDDFMIQTGDPATSNRRGAYNPAIIEETLPAEIRPQYKHVYGAVGAARRSNNPAMASNGSQFYIVENPNGAGHLDNKYTVFGQVVDGFDIIHKIAAVPTDEWDRPINNIRMTVKIKEVKRSFIVTRYNYSYR